MYDRFQAWFDELFEDCADWLDKILHNKEDR
jgi:hypothetical protein